MHADDISEGLVAVGSNVGLSLITGTNLAIYTNVQYIGCMLTSHRIALDPTNQAEERCCVSTKAMPGSCGTGVLPNAGVPLTLGNRQRRITSGFVRCSTPVKGELAPWSKGLEPERCEVRSDWFGRRLDAVLVGVGKIEEDWQEAQVPSAALQEAARRRSRPFVRITVQGQYGLTGRR